LKGNNVGFSFLVFGNSQENAQTLASICDFFSAKEDSLVFLRKVYVNCTSGDFFLSLVIKNTLFPENDLL